VVGHFTGNRGEFFPSGKLTRPNHSRALRLAQPLS
jgi:hypothetical protein